MNISIDHGEKQSIYSPSFFSSFFHSIDKWLECSSEFRKPALYTNIFLKQSKQKPSETRRVEQKYTRIRSHSKARTQIALKYSSHKDPSRRRRASCTIYKEVEKMRDSFLFFNFFFLRSTARQSFRTSVYQYPPVSLYRRSLNIYRIQIQMHTHAICEKKRLFAYILASKGDENKCERGDNRARLKRNTQVASVPSMYIHITVDKSRVHVFGGRVVTLQDGRSRGSSLPRRDVKVILQPRVSAHAHVRGG